MRIIWLFHLCVIFRKKSLCWRRLGPHGAVFTPGQHFTAFYLETSGWSEEHWHYTTSERGGLYTALLRGLFHSNMKKGLLPDCNESLQLYLHKLMVFALAVSYGPPLPNVRSDIPEPCLFWFSLRFSSSFASWTTAHCFAFNKMFFVILSWDLKLYLIYSGKVPYKCHILIFLKIRVENYHVLKNIYV